MSKLMKIAIRGVIVDGFYDGDWAQQYIERGLWTPESAFRRQLDQAEKNGMGVEITVSSQGGSVFAGNDMLAAIHRFKGDKTIVVGAFAASMAANIVLQAGCPVKAHKNSILLYHGAWGLAIGGSGAHLDEATILDQINNPIKTALAAHGVPSESIETGFSEGRTYTMTADEALKFGIVDEIFGDAAPMIDKLTKDDEANLLAKGSKLDLAACSAWESQLSADAGASGSTPPPVVDSPAGTVTPPAAIVPPPAGTVPASVTPPASGTPSGGTEDHAAVIGRLRADLAAAKSGASAAQSGFDKRLAALTAAHAGALQSVQSRFDDLTAEYNAFRATSERDATAAAEQIETLTRELSDTKKAHRDLTGGVLLDSAGAEDMSWPKLIEQYGYDKAKKLFPAKAEEYRKTHIR